MIGTKRKPVKEKTRCDGCRRTVAAVHEYSFYFWSNAAHWLDLCETCGAIDREMKDGFLVGIHSAVTPQNAAPTGPAPTQGARRRRDGLRATGRKKAAST